MLSESLCKTALLMEKTIDTDKRGKQLEKLTSVLDLLVRSHYGLQKGSVDLGLSGKNSSTVIGLYTEMQPDYQAMKTAAQHVLTSIAQNVSDSAHSAELSAFVEELVTKQADFVHKMDAIVSQYETEALAQLNQVKQFAFVLAALILIVLLLEGWYLFRPFRVLQSATDEISSGTVRSFVSIGPLSVHTLPIRAVLILYQGRVWEIRFYKRC